MSSTVAFTPCRCPLCVPPAAEDNIAALSAALSDAQASIAALRQQIADLQPPF